MLSNFDVNHLLTFPLKDTEARKQFLIGTLVYLTAFLVPILPIGTTLKGTHSSS